MEKICAAEKLLLVLVLLVKMLFDEECFKISLKGRDGRAVTEVEKQEIYIYIFHFHIQYADLTKLLNFYPKPPCYHQSQNNEVHTISLFMTSFCVTYGCDES